MLLQGCTATDELEWEPPSADCPLRCPSSRKISKLTVKVYCFCCLYAVYLLRVLASESWHSLFQQSIFVSRKDEQFSLVDISDLLELFSVL